MRVFIAAATLAAALLPGIAARADDGPVVVELFTSQGCSSCPPADAILHDLAKADGVIALALHVDYWDYIGWRDVFGSPRNTQRQNAYARAAGAHTIYTPQFIIGGSDHVIGARTMDIMEQIRAHSGQDSGVTVMATRAGDALRIAATAPRREAMVVQLVRYRPEAAVDVLRGENAGRRLVYSNIVTDWQVVGEWDGAEPLDLGAQMTGDEPAVVIVQGRNAGPILAAAVVR